MSPRKPASRIGGGQISISFELDSVKACAWLGPRLAVMLQNDHAPDTTVRVQPADLDIADPTISGTNCQTDWDSEEQMMIGMTVNI